MNNVRVYKVTQDVIDNFDKNDVKFWAKLGTKRIRDAILNNFTVSEVFCSFPYAPTTDIDDVISCTPIKTSSDELVAKNYLKAFKNVLGVLVDDEKYFNHRNLLNEIKCGSTNHRYSAFSKVICSLSMF